MSKESKTHTIPKTHTILIIEDDHALLNALKDKFTKEGFVVIKAHDGEEGLTMALSDHPDLILLDVIMPKMDGIMMLKALRKDAWGKDAKVIILTNLSDDKRVIEALEQGTHDYLIKADWKIEDVVEKVRKKLHE